MVDLHRTPAFVTFATISIVLGTMIAAIKGSLGDPIEWVALTAFSTSMTMGVYLGVKLRVAWACRAVSRFAVATWVSVALALGILLTLVGAISDPVIGDSANETLFPSLFASTVALMALVARPRIESDQGTRPDI